MSTAAYIQNDGSLVIPTIQTHTFCGHCNNHFMFCGCTLTSGSDYVFLGLPRPPPNSTPKQLLLRWCSILPLSRTMCVFNALAWSKDNADRLLNTFHFQGSRLTAMVEDYIKQLPRDRTLVHLATICGNTSTNPGLSIEPLSNEVRTACRDFLRGDWACVTKLGAAMLNNTFQTSNPEIYPLHDVNLKTIFDGLNVLIYVQGLGYSTTGWTLAMEMDRTQSLLDKVFRASSQKKNPPPMKKPEELPRGMPDAKANIKKNGGKGGFEDLQYSGLHGQDFSSIPMARSGGPEDQKPADKSKKVTTKISRKNQAPR